MAPRIPCLLYLPRILAAPGYPSPGGIIGVEQYLNKHEENATLREKIRGLELELQYLRDQNLKEIDSLKTAHAKELTDAKDNKQIFMSGLQMFAERAGF